MTCEICAREDPLQVLDDHLCRSCMESRAKGVDIYRDVVENVEVVTVPGSSFFYPKRTLSLVFNYEFPGACPCFLN